MIFWKYKHLYNYNIYYPYDNKITNRSTIENSKRGQKKYNINVLLAKNVVEDAFNIEY